MKHSILLASMLAALNVQAETLDTIIVETGLIDSQIDDVIRSVTVIDRDQIESSGATTAIELLQSVPGVSIDSSGGTGMLANISLRGQRLNSISVMVDGRPINNPGSGVAPELSAIDSSSIERIEVVRGGNSAVGGNNAMSGSINIVTRRDNYAIATLSGSRGHQLGMGMSVEGAQSTFFMSGYLKENADQYAKTSEVQTFDLAAGGTVDTTIDADKDPSSSRSMTFGLESQLTAKTSLDTSIRLGSDTVHFDSGSPDDITDNDFMALSLALTHEQSSALSHELTYNRYTNNASTTGSWPSEVDGQREAFSYLGKLQTANGELAAKLAQEELTYVNGGTSQDNTINSVAAEYRGNTASMSYFVGIRAEDSDLFTAANSSSLGLTYFASDAVELSLNLGQNVKNPSMQQIFGYTGLWQPNADLEPETDTSAGIGVRYFMDSGNLEAVAFMREIDNKIAMNSTWDGSENLKGKTEISGIELSANLAISDAINLSAQYTYTDAKDPEGEKLVRTPESTAAVNANYTAGKLSAFGGVQWTSETEDTYFAPDFTSHRVILPARTTVTAGVAYQLDDNLSVSLNGTNLLDDDNVSQFGYSGEGRRINLTFKGSF